MPDGLVVYRFGPFEFDARSRALFERRKRVPLSTPQSALLHCLLAHAGTVVPKERLIDASWQGQAVSDGSLDVAIHRLRKVLGKDCVYIETHHHHGFSFVAPLEQLPRELADPALEAHLEPFLVLVKGRAEIDTLDIGRIRQARARLEQAIAQQPAHARAHILLAQACAWEYEASATRMHRDTTILDAGIAHAQCGCELTAQDGEAWSTLAYLLALKGDRVAASAAAQKAFAFEPDNWRHELRLAKVTWGEERLQAARRALTLNPALGQAHWMRATVFIARGALDLAVAELQLGCAAQDAQPKGHPYPALGNHLLLGLVFIALGRLEEALAEFARELDTLDPKQVFAQICAANTWCARGAVLVRQGYRDQANAAFERALAINPRHVQATAALRGEIAPNATGAEAVIARAIVLVRGNRHADAAEVYRAGLAQAPPGHAGWMLAVEPLLQVSAHPEIWDKALALVAARAV